MVFAGAAERTQVKRLTNGRWALSAFGTATAASLSPADTVYGLTPVHHPSSSNEVRIAAYDHGSGRLIEGRDGFAKRCGRGETAMLLVTAEREAVSTATALRGVFARDDSWLETGDLFERDGDDGRYRRLTAARRRALSVG